MAINSIDQNVSPAPPGNITPAPDLTPPYIPAVLPEKVPLGPLSELRAQIKGLQEQVEDQGTDLVRLRIQIALQECELNKLKGTRNRAIDGAVHEFAHSFHAALTYKLVIIHHTTMRECHSVT